MDIVAAKKDLRAVLMARREAIAPGDREAAAASIAEIGTDTLSADGPQIVSVFMPFGSEVDTLPLMRALASKGHRLCLPVIVVRNEPLIFRQWAPGDRLVPGRFRIDVPVEDAAVLKPQVMFVPLLGFDARGYRIGYGGGYYDRTIALLRRTGSLRAIGLCLAEQEVGDVPHADYDERLDAVLTQKGCRQFWRED